MKAFPRSANRKSSNRGFTLLEVMIALGIFALIAAGSYQLLRGETTAQSRLQQSSDRLNQWQRGLTRLSSDLLQVIPRSVRDEYGNNEPPFRGDDNSLTLTRGGWSNPLGSERSQLQRVHYDLDSEQAGKPYLRRSYWFHLDRPPGSDPQQQRLIDNLESITFRYYDNSENRWLDEWPPADGSPASALPKAVEITLLSEHFGEIRRVWSLPDGALK